MDFAPSPRAEEMRAAHGTRQTQAVEAALGGMTSRILAIHSIDDEQCALANSQRMVEIAPDADLMLVDGLGHRFIAQDGDVLERIAEFVEAP